MAPFNIDGRLKRLKNAIKNDTNINNFVSLATRYGPKVPKATVKYFSAKVPIIQWISRYSLPWLADDLLAGITIGILLVPQSLAYAKVAGIPPRYGLISSWIPTLFYAIMGTSKDVTAGPTAIIGLLTGEIVKDFVSHGYSAQAVASAAAFWVGIYALILGLFRLGFLLNFIPLPVLSGYVSGAAITIVLQQLKGLFGEPSTGSDTAGVIRLFFKELPETNWRAFLVGATGIIMLVSLQFVGQRWGKKYKALWYLSVARNALALVIFTAVSWGVNRHHKTPLFGISKVTGAGIIAPKSPDTKLLVKVAGRSIAVFLAAVLEHLAIGKAFGRRHGYVIEQDQELSYVGLTNLFGSFFSAMPITGGFSRTAVNSESGVKSPLSGLATTACVLVSIYKLTDAFYWIPSATLSAIIIVAVWQIILPARVFWHYWKTSFADFVGSMVAFWVTLFVDVEIGIASAVGFSLVYILLQLAFSRVTLVTKDNFTELYPNQGSSSQLTVPDDTMLFMLQDSVLFPNAARVTRRICDYIYMYSKGIQESFPTEKQSDRLWNDTRSRKIASLRREAGTLDTKDSLPSIRAIVIDMSRVAHVDTTGIQALADIRSNLIDWAGPEAKIRFVGLNSRLKTRFQRADETYFATKDSKTPQDSGYVVFDILQSALYNSLKEETVGKSIDTIDSADMV